MLEQKSAFINEGMFALLKGLDQNTKANWGKMSAQQMVEHLAYFFDVSTEKLKFGLVTPEEHLPKYMEFLKSDKEFRENTKAPTSVLGEEPLLLVTKNIEEAIGKLRVAVDDFFDYFKSEPAKKTMHPAFGLLNFEEWVLLHHKHITHHLKQFGLIAAV
jgi:hypothetical protein